MSWLTESHVKSSGNSASFAGETGATNVSSEYQPPLSFSTLHTMSPFPMVPIFVLQITLVLAHLG